MFVLAYVYMDCTSTRTRTCTSTRTRTWIVPVLVHVPVLVLVHAPVLVLVHAPVLVLVLVHVPVISVHVRTLYERDLLVSCASHACTCMCEARLSGFGL